MPDAEAAASQLETVRDFLRWALSSFAEAKIAHGHGTTSALDEAAFIILETLHLPVDDINPWLDARLLEPERRRLAELIRDRVILRKPAAYLMKRIYIRGIPFYVDERVIVPRSYIGELMMSGLFAGEASLSRRPGTRRRRARSLYRFRMPCNSCRRCLPQRRHRRGRTVGRCAGGRPNQR